MTQSEAIIGQYVKTIIDLQNRLAEAAGELAIALEARDKLQAEVDELKKLK